MIFNPNGSKGLRSKGASSRAKEDAESDPQEGISWPAIRGKLQFTFNQRQKETVRRWFWWWVLRLSRKFFSFLVLIERKRQAMGWETWFLGQGKLNKRIHTFTGTSIKYPGNWSEDHVYFLPLESGLKCMCVWGVPLSRMVSWHSTFSVRNAVWRQIPFPVKCSASPNFSYCWNGSRLSLQFPFSKQSNRLVGSEWPCCCSPVPRASCVSKVEESNLVHTRLPIATLWHEMMLSRGNL